MSRTSTLMLANGAYWAYTRLVERQPPSELIPRPGPIVISATAGVVGIGSVILSLVSSLATVVVLWLGWRRGLWRLPAPVAARP